MALLRKAAIGVTYFALISGFMLAGAWAADSLKIGVLLPLTGSNAKFGLIQKKSVRMAVDEINAAGGINKIKIEPIIADTQGKLDTGRAAIERLITRDKVLLIGGGFSSSVTWATISIAQQKKIAFLVNSASADKITEQDWNYIFRLNQPISEHLETLASFIKTLATDIKSVAIVHAKSLKSSSDARKFFKKAGALGLKMVIKESFESGADDFRPLLTRVKTKNPDLLYTVTDSVRDAALLTRHSKELNLNPKLFVGGAIGFARPEFTKNAGIASNYVACTTQWTTSVPYPGAKEYHTKFKAKYHTPPTYHGAQAYAAIYVMADALKRTKVLTPGNVRDALAKTNLKTIFGPVKFISYNKKSRQNRLPTYLVQWIDGKAEIVWPKHLATKKAVYPMPK
jgi:branched-chain amino acid transport system substrate-binding protein